MADILARFYDGLFSTNVVANIYLQDECKVVKDLTSFDLATFIIDYQNEIKQDIRFELIEIQGGMDNVVFCGYVYEVKPSFETIGLLQVTVRSQKALMLRRKVLADQSFVAQTPIAILQSILNTYTSTYFDPRTYLSDISDTVTLDVSQGDTIYDIIDELAEQTSAEWDIVDDQIRFLQRLGDDKTSGTNYTEVIFDGRYPSNNNIREISVVGQAKRANIIIGIDKTGNKSLQQDLSDSVVYGVEVKRFRDGDLIAKTAKALLDSNQDVKIFNVKVDYNSIEVSKGDRIRLTIQNTIDIMNIDTTVIVVKVETIYKFGGKFTEVFVSDIVRGENSLAKIVNGVQKDLDYLKV